MRQRTTHGRAHRRHFGFVLGVGAIVLAACSGGGGGGQLAAGTGGTTTTTPPPGTGSGVDSGSSVAPIAASKLATPRSARAASKALSSAETGIRASGVAASDLRSLGRQQQRAYRAIAEHPEWAASVVTGVPAGVRAAVQANIDAGAALSALTPSGGQAPTTFPEWHILRPESVASLRSYYDEAEQATGIPWAYLAAIHLVETRLGRIRGPSSAGAQGPMQFIPATWASYGRGDINSNHDAIQAAGRYLESRGGPADMDRALFSYNNDDRYVAAVQAYASVLLADPDAYGGYYQWQVFYATGNGVFLLPEGYARNESGQQS